MSAARTNRLVALGRVSGLYGVKGWLKVHSYTEPRANIVSYGSWILRRDGRDERFAVEAGRGHGAGVVVKLAAVDDRDRASALLGAEILVERTALPECEPGEYYWTDLEGLAVRTPAGEPLGTVDHLIATGAHDVLVLAGERERLVPFVPGKVIVSVDLEAGVIVADWSPDD